MNRSGKSKIRFMTTRLIDLLVHDDELAEYILTFSIVFASIAVPRRGWCRYG